jgi:hypothetical protein
MLDPDHPTAASPPRPRRRRGDPDGELKTLQQERRRARNCHELTELFNERADMRGVSPVADFFADAARWSA